VFFDIWFGQASNVLLDRELPVANRGSLCTLCLGTREYLVSIRCLGCSMPARERDLVEQRTEFSLSRTRSFNAIAEKSSHYFSTRIEPT